MIYNFDEVIERRNTYSMKWDAEELLRSFGMCEKFDKNTIPMFVADMDFQCPQPVIDAMHMVADRKIYGYSGNFNVPEYNNAIIRWFRDRRDWIIKPEEIIYVNGTLEGIKYAMQSFTKEGDGIIIQTPIYGPFMSIINELKRKTVSNSLINKGSYYSIDFEDLEEKAKVPENKILILCNPHNPVGRIYDEGELKRISEICIKYDVIIVSDEIHGDIIRRDSRFHPIASVADNKNIITCTATTKSFNLAGLQCSNVIVKEPGLRLRLFETIMNSAGANIQSPFSIASLIAAYNEGDEWMDQVNDYIDDNIDWVLCFLKREMPKVKCIRPQGTYFLWMDLRDYGLSDKEIHDRIANKANVILEDGITFDPEGGSGFIRACIPTRRALLQEAFQRIAKEFEDLK